LPVIIQYDEQGITPSPCIIVFQLSDRLHRVRVAGIKSIRAYGWEESIARVLRPHRHVVANVRLVKVEKRCLLMISVEKEDGSRLSDQTKKGSLQRIPLGNCFGVHRADGVDAEIIAHADVEIVGSSCRL
jgi:hypothetical protein